MKKPKGSRYYRDLAVALVKKEIKVRYKSNILGYAWSILNPLSQALIYLFAFQYVLKVKIDNYVLFLVLGLFPWQWLQNSVIASSVSMIANANLVKKTIFPREFIVFSVVLNDMFHFIISLPVLFLFLFIYRHHVVMNPVLWLLFPVLAIIQMLFIAGLGLLVSSINVFFRDLERLVGILINFIFYGTPVVYAVTMIPDKFHFIIYLNPMALLILNYRNIFLYDTISWGYLWLSLIYGAGVFIIGYTVFNKLKSRFAEAL